MTELRNVLFQVLILISFILVLLLFFIGRHLAQWLLPDMPGVAIALLLAAGTTTFGCVSLFVKIRSLLRKASDEEARILVESSLPVLGLLGIAPALLMTVLLFMAGLAARSLAH